MIFVSTEHLTDLVARCFAARGVGAEEAAQVARSLVGANLTGHDSHGVVRVPRYLSWLEDGTLQAGAELGIDIDAGPILTASGNHGFGQVMARRFVALGIERARAHGIAVTALHHSGHVGRLGEWAEMAAEAGLVSIHFANVAGSVLVAPFGAREKRLSTAPLAMGAPVADGPPVILDLATSMVAEGKVLNALRGGGAVPDGAIIAADGTPSSLPEDFYGSQDPDGVPTPSRATGALAPMGEHKGSGIAVMMEILGGLLTGGTACGPARVPLTNNMLSIYIAPEALHPGDAFPAAAAAYADWVRSAAAREGVAAVLVPGDPERARAAARGRDGIPLPAGVWEALCRADPHHGNAARSVGRAPDER